MANAYDVVVQPVITEKAMELMEDQNVYTFIVAEKASKPQISEAVERLWDVRVRKVRTMRYAGKYRRGLLGQMAGNWIVGRRNDFKKALVSLEEGDHIEFYEVG
ncbi:MAG: 50S ribosomal protein L23 [Gemmatimonadetes bacterium]|nr:50S ribosomal protein L23 [Gemmatimonadota bacterium]NIP77788.1 50S ribosomal protein L23 [Gemmatimonadota bacterium]NIR77091.1 50S ribosomal protein L23 [Gemmatimonadota bacterium]NIU29443.1 50S ribosomal protein L23 [Gemmatimonadota bacterium]NIV59857.1 50S ribosomal protein L23 [Gemmatimonadota bacterium]